jgi:hypothetical protein
MSLKNARIGIPFLLTARPRACSRKDAREFFGIYCKSGRQSIH